MKTKWIKITRTILAIGSIALIVLFSLSVNLKLKQIINSQLEEIALCQEAIDDFEIKEENYFETINSLKKDLANAERLLEAKEAKIISAYTMSSYQIEDVEDLKININISEEDLIAMAKMAWGESGCVKSMIVTLSDGTTRYVSNTEQIAACYWTVLNRVDSGYGNIIEVITAPNQYLGYSANNHLSQALVDLAKDCIIRWQLEKALNEIGIYCDIGRVLPKPAENGEWCWFVADGKGHNSFRDRYNNTDGARFTWNLPTPYETDIIID